MPIIYRTLLPGEEDMVFELRSQVLDTPREICSQLFTDFGTDDQCYDHTLVAVDETGAIISTAGYWLRMIRGIDGMPQRVGHLYGVATCPEMRGKGHAGRLLSLAKKQMRKDGCVLSVLCTRDAARPLYKRHGWKTYMSKSYGAFTAAMSSIQVLPYTIEQIPADRLDRLWGDLAAIYSAYNAERPLTLLRTESYWNGYVGWMLRDWMEYHRAHLFVARQTETGKPCAYAIAHIYDEDYAQEHFDSPPWCMASEFAVLPDQSEALPALMDGVIAKAAESYAGGYSRWIAPETPEVNAALRRLGGDHVYDYVSSDSLMARPISPTVTRAELDALFAAPGGIFWHMDQY